jgi:prolipoprotein diacylglyceryltransferase
MELETVQIIQYIIMVVVCIFFSAVAIDRKTILTSLIASIAWMTTGLINFIVEPTGFGTSVSLFFWLIGFVFIGAFLHAVVTSWFDSKQARWNPL